MQTSCKLLLIESDPGVHAVVSTILRHHGCDVISVYTPEDLDRQLEHNAPDVALVDMVVDDANGLRLIETLREHRSFGGRPIGMLCGRCRRGDRERARLAGADAFFPLPFDEVAVLAWLEAPSIAA